jgi:hypothetical protein
MRGLRALFAGTALRRLGARPDVVGDEAFLVANAENAPRSVMSASYGDLSDLLSAEPDRSLDPVLSRVTDSTLTIATGRVPKRGTLAERCAGRA